MTKTSTEAVRGLAKELRRIAGVHEDAHRRHGAEVDRQAADMLEAMLREREVVDGKRVPAEDALRTSNDG